MLVHLSLKNKVHSIRVFTWFSDDIILGCFIEERILWCLYEEMRHFSKERQRRVLSSGIQCSVVCWKSTNVSEEHVTSEMLVDSQQTTVHYIPDDRTLQSHHLKTSDSYKERNVLNTGAFQWWKDLSSPVPVCLNEDTALQYWSVSLGKENSLIY